MVYKRAIVCLMFGCALVVQITPALAHASATSWLNGTVANIVCVNGQSSCSFTLSGSRTVGPPSCANSDPTYAFVANTSVGDAILKLLLAAKAAGWKVNAYGRNTCTTTYGNAYQEDLDYIQLSN
jgi:hypothetical protein